MLNPSKFRLTTLAPVVTAALRSARRFPLVLATGALAAYAGIQLADINPYAKEQPYFHLIFSVILGLPLFFAITVFMERRQTTRSNRWIIPAFGIAALVGFWGMWPNWSSDMQRLRFIQIAVAFHLLVAFLPYVGFNQTNSFWQYNRVLFSRFLTSVFYSAALFAGLSLAFLAVDKLLGVEIQGDAYLRLWFIIAFVFNTWFFVSDIPEDLSALETKEEYPRELRMFTQWVLVPIVSVYLLILTIYLVKVLVTGEWPSGWIGYLVSSVATVGILSWLLVYPLEEREGYDWVKTFSKWFYILIMPAIVMLWMAIWKRVEQYGITEERYFLIVLSIWFAAIAVYYTFFRSRNIKVIPMSLCIVALITFAGPWGAYTVSRKSQTGRLEEVLRRYNLLSSSGVLQRTSRVVPVDDRKAIRDGFEYLLKRYNERAISAWLPDSVKKTLANNPKEQGWPQVESDVKNIMSSINVGYIDKWGPDIIGSKIIGPENFFNIFGSQPSGSININGYTHSTYLNSLKSGDSVKISDHVFVRFSNDSTGLVLVQNGTPVLTLQLSLLADSAMAYKQKLPPGRPSVLMLRAEASNAKAAAFGYFTELEGIKSPKGPRVIHVEGSLFVRVQGSR